MTVDINRARSFITPYEGWEPKLYPDVYGFPTCAVGNLVTQATVINLPWVRDSDGGPATGAEILDAFATIKGAPVGHLAAFYRGFTKIHLTDQAILDLFTARVAEFTGQLVDVFPAYESWPGAGQLAELDMIFNAGEGTLLKRFPTHVAALRQHPPDWRTAAAQCHRVNPDKTVKPWDGSNRHEQRQIAVRDLLLSCVPPEVG